MATTWDNVEKSGSTSSGWEYGERNLEYGSLTDPDGNSKVYYGSIGLTIAITNQVKN